MTYVTEEMNKEKNTFLRNEKTTKMSGPMSSSKKWY